MKTLSLVTVVICLVLATTATAETATTESLERVLVAGQPGNYVINTGSSQMIEHTYVVTTLPPGAKSNLVRWATDQLKVDGSGGSALAAIQKTAKGPVILLSIAATERMQASLAESIKLINQGEISPFSQGTDAIHYHPKYRSSDYLVDLVGNEISSVGYCYSNKEVNILTVVDEVSNLPWLKGVLETNDQPAPRVTVGLQVVEFREGMNSRLGVYWDAWKRSLPTNMTVSLSGGRTPLPAYDLEVSSFDVLLEGINPQALALFLNYLQDKGVARVDTKTTINVVHSKPAIFQAGRTIPYRLLAEAGQPAVDREVFEGIKLEINSILSKNTNRLQVEACASSVVGIAENGAPIVSSSQVSSSVAISEKGKSFSLSGLKLSRQVKEMRGIPILRSVPILKWAFSSEEKSEEKWDVVIIASVE